jgi:hypothetical protein
MKKRTNAPQENRVFQEAPTRSTVEFIGPDNIPPQVLPRVSINPNVHKIRYISAAFDFTLNLTHPRQTINLANAIRNAVNIEFPETLTDDDMFNQEASILFLGVKNIVELSPNNRTATVHVNTNIVDQSEDSNVKKTKTPLQVEPRVDKCFLTVLPNQACASIGKMILTNNLWGAMPAVYYNDPKEQLQGIERVEGNRFLMSASHICAFSLQSAYDKYDFKNTSLYVSIEENAFDYWKRNSLAMIQRIISNRYRLSDVNFSAWINDQNIQDDVVVRVIVDGFVLIYDPTIAYSRCIMTNELFANAHGIDLKQQQ